MIYKWSVKAIITSFLLIFIFLVPTPKAEAMEPISMTILASILLPYAIEFVKVATPYILQGCKNLGTGMLDVFVDTMGIAFLPFGMMEATLGAPFGLFTDGIINIGKGCWAPFQIIWSTLKLPVRVFTG